MNCKFCNRFLQPTISDAGAKTNDPHLFDYYRCEHCKVSFKECQNKVTDYFMNYGKYRAHFNLEEKNFTLLKVFTPAKPGSLKKVMQLNHLPDITPDNFPYKIPTLITFS